MADDAASFAKFTQELAQRVRVEEKRRTWRLVGFLVVLIALLFGLMARMQYNDQRLRQSLIRQCEARNVILEIHRDHYRELVIRTQQDVERGIYADTLAKLSALPPSQNCDEFK